MLRFLLAAFSVGYLLSGAASFAPVTKLSRNKPAFRHEISKKLSLSLSPGDIAAGLANIPGPLLYPTVFTACFRIGAAIAVIGQPRLPSGDDADASSSRLVGSKVVRLPELGSRVRVFYPISEEAGETLSSNKSRYNDAKYCTDGRATSDGMAGLVGFKQTGLSFLLAHLADAPSGCYTEDTSTSTSAISETANYNGVLTMCESEAPLLVYSHGYGGNMDMATYFLRAMAQKGIVVAAVEHTDGTASSTVLPDDRRLDFDPSLNSLKDGLDRRARELLEAAKYIPTLLPGDCRGVVLGGHSYGAPSALLASQRQQPWDSFSSPKISGLILHDPALSMGRGLQLPPRIPTVSYVSDEYNRAGIQCGDATYHVQGAFHGNFVDAPLWAPLWVMRTLSAVIPACGPADPEMVHSQLAESARAFCSALDANNRGGGDSLVATTAGVRTQSLFERVA